MIDPELREQLEQAARSIMIAKNQTYDGYEIIKMHNAYEAIKILIDPTFTPLI